jgi:hypothetical protein
MRTEGLQIRWRLLPPLVLRVGSLLLWFAVAQATGREPTARYQTRLDLPPGPPTDAAGNFIPMSQWDPNHWPKHIHPPREESKGIVP